MTARAIIGGTGLSELEGLKVVDQVRVETPFGTPSNDIIIGELEGQNIAFLPRHGSQHRIPPHKINYRANMWALKELGIEQIIAVAAVGGIRQDMAPGVIAIPDQIIDYTYGRQHTVFSEDFTSDNHIDFTEPYSHTVRKQLLDVANSINLDVVDGGTYGATQGPRLETAAEIKRMQGDGCDMVGMTGMPEAAVARELKLDYATCAVMVNWAAGLGEGPITMADIELTLEQGMSRIKQLLLGVIALP